MDKLELERLLGGAHGLGSIVTVKVPDQADYPAMVKDVQYHPVRGGQVIHADFQGISLTKTLRTVVPIVLHGTPPWSGRRRYCSAPVKGAGGGVSASGLTGPHCGRSKRSRPHRIPFVRDLAVPEKVEILTDRDEVIVTVLAPRPEEEEEEVEEEAVDEGVAVPEAEAEKAADKDEE